MLIAQCLEHTNPTKTYCIKDWRPHNQKNINTQDAMQKKVRPTRILTDLQEISYDKRSIVLNLITSHLKQGLSEQLHWKCFEKVQFNNFEKVRPN